MANREICFPPLQSAYIITCFAQIIQTGREKLFPTRIIDRIRERSGRETVERSHRGCESTDWICGGTSVAVCMPSLIHALLLLTRRSPAYDNVPTMYRVNSLVSILYKIFPNCCVTPEICQRHNPPEKLN